MKLSAWRKAVGLSRMTVYRLRKAGKLKTVTRYRQVYITAEGIRDFFVNDGTQPVANNS